MKTFKKAKSKKASKATRLWIKLAGELLGSTAFLSLSSLGKKKNAALRGALLGTVAGLGAVMLQDEDRQKEKSSRHEGYPAVKLPEDPVLAKAVQVALYALAGLIAGKMMQSTGKKKKKK